MRLTYKYSAISKDGRRVSGIIEGYNELDAAERIKETCDIVLKMTEVRDKNGFLSRDIGGTKLDMKAFTVMCSQFAIILRAGIPIARTVHLIADKTTDKNLKRILQVADDVEAGRSISASFEERGGKLLPATFVDTIRAGEETGSIDAAFNTMHRHLDKQTRMSARVRGALAYPVFVLFIAVVVVIVIMVKVVPTFTAIFDSYGAELPAITKALIAISHFFSRYWLVMLAVAIAFFLFYKLYGNTEEGRLKFAVLGRKLPVLGNINELNSASQFAIILRAGIPIARTVHLIADKTTDKNLKRILLSGRLEEGHGLGTSLRDSACMPDILTDMVAVGEETGELQSTMETVASYYDNELEQAINAAIAKLEPTLLVFMAVVAGFIVIAVYMAMFSMYSVM